MRILRAYPDIDRLASQASRKRSSSRLSRTFYTALHQRLLLEDQRNTSDQQALVRAIKDAMDVLAVQLNHDLAGIEPVRAYPIRVPGFARGKLPDYAFRKGNKVYLLEQKSILRFNEFAQVLVEAMLAKRHNGTHEIRFGALFHFHHQERSQYQPLCGDGTNTYIDHVCILVPSQWNSGYSGSEVDELYEDIRAWLA